MYQDLLKQINKKNWHFYVTRRMNWLTESVQILCIKKDVQEKYYGFAIPTNNYLILNGDEYYCDDDTEINGKILDKLFKKDSHFFDKFAANVYKVIKETQEYKKKVQHSDINDFYDKYLKSYIPAWMRPDFYLEPKVQNLPITPFPITEKVVYLEEPLALLKIAKKFKDGQDVDKLLDKHVKKYSWIKCAYIYEDVAYTKKDYLDRIKNLIKTKDIPAEIKKIIKYRKQTQIDYQNSIKNNNITGKDLILCEATRKFVNLRTYATETSDNLFFLARHTVLKKYADKLGISTEDITMLTPQEIITGDIGKIKERLSGYSIIKINGKVTYLFGKEANDLQKYISDKYQKVTKTTKIIKGTPASLGKVTSRACVMLSYKDVGKMKKGEILVATMTSPEYISAMEKASAFVTDEGGITCHAAIIAREFNLPCVMGTHNATKIIKDGDLIEVDADTGIVKVLK